MTLSHYYNSLLVFLNSKDNRLQDLTNQGTSQLQELIELSKSIIFAVRFVILFHLLYCSLTPVAS